MTPNRRRQIRYVSGLGAGVDGQIPVVHPTWVGEEQVSGIIGEIVRRRRPVHSSYRWKWAVAVPLSLPFSLLPGGTSSFLGLILVLPNLPLFYAAYRLWSHHKGEFIVG